MKKNKKIIMSLTAVCTSIAVLAGGAFAYFIAYDTTDTAARVGSVFLDVSDITIGQNAVYETTLDEDGYVTSTGSEIINGAEHSVSQKIDATGELSVATNTYPNGDNPSLNWASKNARPLNDVYFRGTFQKEDGSKETGVVYCIDYGLSAPEGNHELDESQIVTEDVKKILTVGYPTMDKDDYPTYAKTDKEVEWATSVAIYIAENSAYFPSGNYATGHELSLSSFKRTLNNKEIKELTPYLKHITGGESPSTYPGEPISADLTNKVFTFADIMKMAMGLDGDDYKNSYAESYRLYKLVEEILAKSEKIATVDDFILDGANAFTDPIYEKISDAGSQFNKKEKLAGYLVGPFTLTNTVSTADLTLTEASGKSFTSYIVDAAGKKITNLSTTYADPFYVRVALSDVDKDFRVTAESREESNYSMYTYWSGDRSYQKMIYASPNHPKATVTVPSLSFDEYKYLNPGDVITVKWDVANTGTKAVATRNLVSIYWKGNKESVYSNYKDIIYIYPEKTNSSHIFGEQFGLYPSEYLDLCKKAQSTSKKDTSAYVSSYGPMESMDKVIVDKNEYKAGYSFIVYGDVLDGIGYGAETGHSIEVDYNSSLDDKNNYKDTIAFKMLMSSRANIHTMDDELVVRVETQAMQYLNTSNAEWNKLFRESYSGSYSSADFTTDVEDWDSLWVTVAEHEYVLSGGTGSYTDNNPMDKTQPVVGN